MLAGVARQQSCWHCGCTEDTAPSTSTRTMHRSGTSQQQPTHNNDNAAEDIDRGSRAGGHTHDGYQQNMRVNHRHPSAHAPPHPRAHNPSCTVGAHREHVLLPDSPVTCAPVGGQHAAQCMAARPPLQGGSKGLSRGTCPDPAHHLALETVPRTLLEHLALATLTAMMADLEKNTLVVRQSVLFKVRATVIALLSRDLFQDREKGRGRSPSPICRLPLGLGSYCGCTYSKDATCIKNI